MVKVIHMTDYARDCLSANELSGWMDGIQYTPEPQLEPPPEPQLKPGTRRRKARKRTRKPVVVQAQQSLPLLPAIAKPILVGKPVLTLTQKERL